MNMQDKTRLDESEAYELVTVIEKEIGKVIVGQQLMIRRLLTGLFAAIPYSFMLHCE